jgi:hypothetical protein
MVGMISGIDMQGRANLEAGRGPGFDEPQVFFRRGKGPVRKQDQTPALAAHRPP